MDQQALIAALMGGQNSAMPSQISSQPDPAQFSPQMLGYGSSPQGMTQLAGMFSPPPYGAQAQMNMQPPNMMGY